MLMSISLYTLILHYFVARQNKNPYFVTLVKADKRRNAVSSVYIYIYIILSLFGILSGVFLFSLFLT